MLARRAGIKVKPPKPLTSLPAVKETGIKLLCIGDSHAHPDYQNHRYEWLGRFAADHQPDVIWDAGDWWDMPSCSSYDKGQRGFEGRRYWRDIDAGIDAMERFEYQLKKHAPKSYKPRKVRTLGNHENRINRITQLDPMLDGIVGTHDLMSAEFGWEEHPFLHPVEVGGAVLCHYFQSGVMGRPIGGENPAAMLLKKGFSSSLQGHSHLLDYCDRRSFGNGEIQAMHVGCYFDYDFQWAGEQVNRLYRRGLLLLNNLKDGSFDPEWWSMERVRARYG